MSDLVTGLALGLAATAPVGGVAAAVGLAVERLTRDLTLTATTAPAVAMLGALRGAAAVHASAPQAVSAFDPTPAVGVLIAHAGTDGRLAASAIVAAALISGAVWLARRLAGAARLSVVLRNAKPLADRRLDARVVQQARRLGVPAVHVLISETVREPLLAGVRRPVILLPAGLASKLATNSLALICAHELAHLARRDNLFAPLQGLALALLWFNPFAHLLARRIAVAREEACDQIALSGRDGAERKTYAEALVAVLRQAAGPNLQSAFTGSARKAAMRLQSILKPSPAASRRVALFAAALVGAVGLGAFGASATAAQMNRAVASAQALDFEADLATGTPSSVVFTGSPRAHGIVPVEGYIVLIDGRRAAAGEDLDALTGIEQIEMFTPRAKGDDNLIRITLKH